MSAKWVLLLSLLVLPIFADATGLIQAVSSNVNGSETKMVPMMDQEKLGRVVLNDTIRRRLGSLRLCAPCTCCGGPRNICIPSPCCYAINCNIPNRPFGFCSFTPQVCNCLSCTP